MRKITVACLLLPLLLPAVLASAAADPNTLGLFYDATGTVDQVSIGANTMQVLYLVLMNPVNDDYEGSTRDVGYVSGFECGLVPPSGDCTRMGLERHTMMERLTIVGGMPNSPSVPLAVVSREVTKG